MPLAGGATEPDIAGASSIVGPRIGVDASMLGPPNTGAAIGIAMGAACPPPGGSPAAFANAARSMRPESSAAALPAEPAVDAVVLEPPPNVWSEKSTDCSLRAPVIVADGSASAPARPRSSSAPARSTSPNRSTRTRPPSSRAAGTEPASGGGCPSGDEPRPATADASAGMLASGSQSSMPSAQTYVSWVTCPCSYARTTSSSVIGR